MLSMRNVLGESESPFCYQLFQKVMQLLCQILVEDLNAERRQANLHKKCELIQKIKTLESTENSKTEACQEAA